MPYNHLYVLLQLFPNKPWNSSSISLNSNITESIIDSMPNINWNYPNLSDHPNISWEYIRTHMDKPWWWNYVSMNPNVTWEIIQANPDLEWNWHYIPANPNIKWEIIESHPKLKNVSIGMGWRNPNITWDIINTNPNRNWSYYNLPRFKDFTLEILEKVIEANPQKNWDWYYISANKCITWQFIETHPNKPWNWAGISRNPNITIEIVEAHPEKDWSWCNLSDNPNITWQFVLAHLDKHWHWYLLSLHPNITWQIIQAHPEKPWNWRGVSQNPNITWQIVANNLDKPWNWTALGENKFDRINSIIRIQRAYRKRRRVKAANIIANWWKPIFYQPDRNYYKRVMKKIKSSMFKTYIDAAEKIVVLTGAGISTDSGIPDYRGPDGVLNKNPEYEKCINYHYFMNDSKIRKLAWRYRLESPIWLAEPNPGHMAIVKLQERGKLHKLITQNVDCLHLCSGILPEKLIEAHGNVYRCVCTGCGKMKSTADVLAKVRAGDLDPRCDDCKCILKPNTIFFEQQLEESKVEEMNRVSSECDLFIAIGTSLQMYPVARTFEIAKESGTKTIIINQQPTSRDELADLVVRENISKIDFS